MGNSEVDKHCTFHRPVNYDYVWPIRQNVLRYLGTDKEELQKELLLTEERQERERVHEGAAHGVAMQQQQRAERKARRGELAALRASLLRECRYIDDIFSVLAVPARMADENKNQDDDYIYVNPKTAVITETDKSEKRAQSIVDLQQRLEKVKQGSNFTLKNKLKKKSLTTKLNKKARKAERKLKDKQNKNKPPKAFALKKESEEVNEKPNIHQAKPVFNSDGKLVFSKFDFTSVGKRDKKHKSEKDPKKILENLKKQEETVKKLQESGDTAKAVGLKEKIAWKNALAKAEGEKVKDDPLLLKKSMKKQDQKKKQSKKKWDERIQKVEQGKQDRQKKRHENITKKKKEKKSTKIKQSVKKGRVVI